MIIGEGPPMTTQDTAAEKRTGRKVRAVAAAGTVLGIGAIVTMAAWNDSEFAEGIFGTGVFNVESSTTGSDAGYQDHDSIDNAAELAFAAEEMVPDETYTASLWLRVDEDTTYDGYVTDIEIANADEAPQTEGISYTIYSTGGAQSCDNAEQHTPVAGGDSLNEITPAGEYDIELPADGGEGAGQPTLLCFVVETDEDLSQDLDETVTWVVHAESTD